MTTISMELEGVRDGDAGDVKHRDAGDAGCE